ncbi:MAG: choice-of-anchor L domain-containing protein [Flavobacteriales bacterium]|nr:choice-of-anchor L domain-containing protein [Flavobacteriales bacterium]
MTVMKAFSEPCGQQYHIKLAIGDADSNYDSAVFLEAGSFTSTGSVLPTLAGGAGVTGNTMLEGCNPVELIFTRLGDITVVDTVNIVISGTT